MAGMGKQVTGDGLPANLAGMSKTQLYEIMSQMKSLIERNQQQARKILIQNPLLTKALFQAQIMLGMVQPPQPVQNVQPPPTQHSQQSNVQAPTFSGPIGMKDQTSGASQLQNPARMQHLNQPPTVTSASIPGLNTQPQPMQLHHPLQAPQPPKGHLNAQVTPASVSQSSQIPNAPSLPHHSSSQPPPLHQPQVPTSSGQLQQPLQTTGIPHMTLQPPLLPQPRPFQHQYPQMGPNVGFQHAGAPQHLSQPSYHTSAKPPHVGPSFPHAQVPNLSQPPPQPVYQVQPGGMPSATEFHSQVGSSMQADRGSSWMSTPPENPRLTQHSTPVPGPMGPGNQPARPQSLTPEMEKALLQQVMSLTPDQINLLPPEQRNQVLQLQQILRQ